MKKMLLLSAVTIALCGLKAQAKEGHAQKLMEACKAECPSAKTAHESHECMNEVSKKKSSDKKFEKSACMHAYKEHMKEEMTHGHKH